MRYVNMAFHGNVQFQSNIVNYPVTHIYLNYHPPIFPKINIDLTKAMIIKLVKLLKQ